MWRRREAGGARAGEGAQLLQTRDHRSLTGTSSHNNSPINTRIICNKDTLTTECIMG